MATIFAWTEAAPTIAKPLDEARSDAILWVERHQNEDGSWGAGAMRPLATAEALLALSWTNRAGGVAAQRAKSWLLNLETESIDYQARAIRALAALGIDVSTEAQALLDVAPSAALGWGPVSGDGVTSYDTALALAALEAAGLTPANQPDRISEVLARRRADSGWSGDGIPATVGNVSAVNGSFEDALVDPGPPYYWANLPAVDARIAGWTVTAGDIDYVGAGHWNAQDGTHSIDLSGWGPGTIQQTLPTEPGVVYEIRFHLAPNPDLPGAKTLDVVVDGVATPFSIPGAVSSGPPFTLVWEPRSLQFSATGATTTIEFRSTTASAVGPALDAIEVAPLDPGSLPVVAPSDLTASAEIVRALANLGVNPAEMAASLTLLGGLVDGSTPTLEVASRLAALHAMGQTHSTLEAALLDDARFPPGSTVWSDDPFVNAIALLALTTKPLATFTDPPLDLDTDGDGKRNEVDSDDDGDGVADDLDAFPLDPTEIRDTDGDGKRDAADSDDDGDGTSDLDELAQGTDPRSADTDGDGVCDGSVTVPGSCTANSDPCPQIAYVDVTGGPDLGVDLDGDGVCTPIDGCDDHADPLDFEDLDGDGQCDGVDDDDDGDGYFDTLELAFGSDPRDAASVPDDVAASDPFGDFDGDGVDNAGEVLLALDPLRADTDGDGFSDHHEWSLDAAWPLDPSLRPETALGAFSGVNAALDPVLLGTGFVSSVTGGQSTPVAREGRPNEPSAGGGHQNLAGFQPTSRLGMDLDGDGLSGQEENEAGSSPLLTDTDGDGYGDAFEVAQGSNPNDPDDDGDGVPTAIDNCPFLSTECIWQVRTLTAAVTDPRDLGVLGEDAAWSDLDGADRDIFFYQGSSRLVTQLTLNSVEDHGPRLGFAEGAYLAWIGSDGDDEVWLYDGTSPRALTVNGAEDRGLAAAGAGVAWEQGGDLLYHLLPTETAGYVATGAADREPQISARWVAWLRDGPTADDLFVAEIESAVPELQVSSAGVYGSLFAIDSQEPPARVVWCEGNFFGHTCYFHALAAGGPPGQIVTGVQVQDIRVFGDYAVWSARVATDTDIYLFHIPSQQLTPVTDENLYEDVTPRISDTHVVWERSQGAGTAAQVMVYEIATQDTIQLTNHASALPAPTAPAIDGSNVVWVGWDPVAGEPTIEMARLDPPACEDGIDNDVDGFTDYPNDPGCDSWVGIEDPACHNGLDDDGDGLTDAPDDRGCKDPTSDAEDPRCDDDVDNDDDGTIDWDGGSSGGIPDTHCTEPWKNRETGGGGCAGVLPVAGASGEPMGPFPWLAPGLVAFAVMQIWALRGRRRTGRSTRGPLMAGTAALALAVLCTTVPLRGSAAPPDGKAQPLIQVDFLLDEFSFFYFEGKHVGGALPAGHRIPMTLAEKRPGSWEVTIEPGALALPPLAFPSGLSVEWRLPEPATGAVEITRDGIVWKITAPLRAYVGGATEGIEFPLRFTTEIASSTGDGLRALRRGKRLDQRSGHLQLVAAGVSPGDAATAPGKPFYVVLSGRLDPVPERLGR